MNTHWTEQPYFAALDWAKEHHDVIVVDRVGTIVADFQFARTAQGWSEFDQKMQAFSHCPFTMETSTGIAADQLLQRGYALYPINPRAAAAYRQRKAPSGTKTDRHDAWSLADALRTDGHSWRLLQAQDESTTVLRLLCRDEVGLIEQRTALVNQLQDTLMQYYPLALESFDDWTQPFAWAFVKRFPTAADLQKGRRRRNFLHTHKLWRPQTAQERLTLWGKGQQLNASPAVVTAKSLLALSLVNTLQTLEQQIQQYRQRIRAAFKSHPDHDIFGSLPGAKDKLAPRLLGELGSVREVFPDADSLMCVAGVSPVSFESGKLRKCRIRWACDPFLRHAVHLWADASRKTCAWAQTYYRIKRSQGRTHADALRCLGKRWLKLLWRLWHDGLSYRESIHLDSLKEHRSFVWPLLSQPPSQIL